MNKWKMTFIFLTGFMLHEVMAHIWLSLEGLLPLTSKFFFGYTITAELNTLFVAINVLLTLFFAYLGFFHTWERTRAVVRNP
jgi:hypothetical protein